MIIIRDAERGDCNAIISLLCEQYNLSDKADKETAAKTVETFLFDEDRGGAVIGYSGDIPFALCIYYYTYSSQDLKKSMFIETIYVNSEYRGAGVGTYLLQNSAQKAEAAGCSRIEWKCSDTDMKAQKFYENSGAEKEAFSHIYFVNEDKLHEFGEFKCSCSSGACSGDCDTCGK